MQSNVVGKFIKLAMCKADMTQKQLAKKIGTTQNVISRWIQGGRNPKKETLKKISEATGQPLSFFLGNAIDNEGDTNIQIANDNVSLQSSLEIAQKYIKKLEEENAKLIQKVERFEQEFKKKKSPKENDWEVLRKKMGRVKLYPEEK